MSLFHSKKEKKRSRIGLVFDIRSATIGAALVVLDSKKPRVLYNVRKGISVQEHLDFDRFIVSMFETFRMVVERVEKKGIPYLNQDQFEKSAIDEVLFIYASPWYTAHTKILTVEEDKPFTVTESLLQKMIKAEEDSFFRERGGNVIERAITSILLNGYSVEHIEDKSVENLSLTFSSTIVPNKIAKGLEDILSKTLHINRVGHHSFPLITFTSVRDVFPDLTNFLLVDVSGEVTDVSLIKDDVLLETASFPKGTHFVLRRFTQDLRASASEAQSMIRMYTEDTLHSNATEQVKRLIKDVQRHWGEDFMSSLQGMRRNLQLPGQVFFITESYFAPVVEEALREADVDKKLEITRISYNMLRNQVTFSDTRLYDPLAAMAAFFLHRKK